LNETIPATPDETKLSGIRVGQVFYSKTAARIPWLVQKLIMLHDLPHAVLVNGLDQTTLKTISIETLSSPAQFRPASKANVT
jgi:hypothetical protein